MRFERELLKGIAPVVVLEILSRGAMYGYELAKAVTQRSGDVLSLGHGTLYPLLYNLEAKGLATASWQETPGQRRRRYYRITGRGSEYLARQKQQWEELRRGVDLALGVGGLAAGTA